MKTRRLIAFMLAALLSTAAGAQADLALSPNVILYPDYIYDLPLSQRRATERVLGQAVSVASAARLPPGVRSVLPATVVKRVIELAEAGQRIRYGDDVTTTLVDLALDWQGGRHDSLGFDQIMRETDAGREYRAWCNTSK